jgi:hypothetical protein
MCGGSFDVGLSSAFGERVKKENSRQDSDKRRDEAARGRRDGLDLLAARHKNSPYNTTGLAKQLQSFSLPKPNVEEHVFDSTI